MDLCRLQMKRTWTQGYHGRQKIYEQQRYLPELAEEQWQRNRPMLRGREASLTVRVIDSQPVETPFIASEGSNNPANAKDRACVQK